MLPGCENEIIQDIPSYGTSQVFSPWMEKIRDQSHPIPQVTNNVQMAPSPEESEYFYDEYVDYPFNDTNLVELSNSSSFKHHHFNRTYTNSTPSYHYIPGDTPTLYAGQSSNKTFLHPLKNNGNSATSSGGFTFFGMPLPTINIGKLWGSERKSERKASNGRSQDIEKLYNLTEPDLQAGGFVPLTPGISGGFMPISDPTSNITNYQIQKDSNHSYWPNDFPSQSTVDLSKKNNPSQNIVSDKGALFGSPTNPQVNQSSYLLSPIITDINQSTHNKDTKYTENLIHEKQNEYSSPSIKSTSKGSSFGDTSSNESKMPHGPKKGLTIDEIVEEIHKNKVESPGEPKNSMNQEFSQLFKGNNTEKIFKSDKTFDEKDSQQTASPSALSVLAVPGGQYNMPVGRKSATITKVEYPHNSSEKTQTSSTGDFRSNNRGGKTTFFNEPDASIKSNPYNNTFGWYYKNYNQSGLEPYIGPGVEKFGSGQNLLKCDIYILSVSIITALMLNI